LGYTAAIASISCGTLLEILQLLLRLSASIRILNPGVVA
jgi:hypothetical protein